MGAWKHAAGRAGNTKSSQSPLALDFHTHRDACLPSMTHVYGGAVIQTSPDTEQEERLRSAIGETVPAAWRGRCRLPCYGRGGTGASAPAVREPQAAHQARRQPVLADERRGATRPRELGHGSQLRAGD